MNAAAMPDSAAPAARILCVDDEPHILAALRRTLRLEGHEVRVAEGGRAGLALLESEPADIVISDMRMPHMDGARFLEQVRVRWPAAVRLLLTGHADVRSILDAINLGEIHRYITKPWDDRELTLVIRQARERQALEQEKQRLEALTRRQNDALKTLNAELEARVEARTRELRQAHDGLLAANDKLKASFLTSIKMLSNMIETRSDKLAGHSRRVADLARRIAARMGLGTQDIQEIFVAGLLHNIGKVGFDDELLATPVSRMSTDQLAAYRKYAVRGEQLLMPLDDLRGAAKLVRAHQEQFAGDGFPDGLSGFDIPLGARILALANDYDNLQTGTLMPRRLRPDEAMRAIAHYCGQRYDPAVVRAFQEISGAAGPARDPLREREVCVAELRPGMVVSRDIVTREGFLLLSADHVLTERLIRQLAEFEQSCATAVTLYIRME